MKQITCMIVDDQIEAIDLIIAHVKLIPGLSIAYTTTNPIEALTFLDSKSVDCIFLDVDMPQFTGLEFIETLKSKQGNTMPKIVLITGYDQYALKGYDYGVFDYLLKPVSFKRFKVAIDRLVFALGEISEVRDFFFAEVDGKKIRIDFNSICYIEGAGNYITIVTADKKVTCYKTLAAIESILPKFNFMRIHKSFIISLSRVQSVRGNDVFVNAVSAQKNIPIGVTYKERLLKTLGISE